MPDPEVTVVIPTRSRWRLLSDAIRCALEQVDVSLGLVVVDDGSLDETPERLAAAEDERIRVLRHEQSRGVAAARNHGIAEARGEWVAFLDDDDLWAPDKLRQQLDAAAASNADFVYTGAVLFNEHNGRLQLEPLPEPRELGTLLGTSTSNPVPGGGSGVLARTRLVQAVDGFDERFFMLADWDLWLRLVPTGSVAACPAILVGYREHSENMHVTQPERTLREIEILASKHNLSGTPREYAVWAARWVAWSHRFSGRRLRSALTYGRSAVAHRSLGSALRAGWVLVYPWNARRSGGPTPEQHPVWLDAYRGGTA